MPDADGPAEPALLALGEPPLRVALDDCIPVDLAGATCWRDAAGRWWLPAFRGRAVVLPADDLDPEDDESVAAAVLAWVEAIRDEDWSLLRGAPLEGDEDWVELRSVMVRVGWGPRAAAHAFSMASARPYDRRLPTSAGWAAAGWVVPAAAAEPQPAFARPVLEARGLLRWAYIDRWAGGAPALPPGPPPEQLDPDDPGWSDVLSRLRQDHHTGESLAAAIDLATAVLVCAGLGPEDLEDPDADPLPDEAVEPALLCPSPIVREAAWFLLREEGDAWQACVYAECQHHWAVEAEEDAFELEEVLELAGYGIANPVDAAYTRRRLLTMAFGDVRDVRLAGAGDVADFVTFYRDWTASGRREEDMEEAARALRGDDSP